MQADRRLADDNRSRVVFLLVSICWAGWLGGNLVRKGWQWEQQQQHGGIGSAIKLEEMDLGGNGWFGEVSRIAILGFQSGEGSEHLYHDRCSPMRMRKPNAIRRGSKPKSSYLYLGEN
ncbi:hypothetical protein VTJ04DRAFT_764 [Mycothermus thermophilus]|uniref:uncharacterized protein n=1 Tax=Humicola insolens TaxID=85995 RepID=UPI00374311BD